MDYDLAKELEVAGFPQGGKGAWVYPLDALMTRSSDRVYAPTLEELLEECGQFVTVERYLNAYVAVDRSSDTRGEGTSYKEAVARLWLALNSS